MTSISRSELAALAAPSEGVRVSVYLPLNRAWPAAQENPVRVKSALDEAERRLVQSGLEKGEARGLLSAARGWEANEKLREGAAGLALLAEPGRLHAYPLPYECPASIDTGSAFHLNPLARMLTWPVDFFLLAISGHAVRLYHGRREDLKPMELPASVPQSMNEYFASIQPGERLRFQTAAGVGAGPPTGLIHGGTSVKDDARQRVHEYVQSVARHIAPRMVEGFPLVLAGVKDVQSTFREAYPGTNLVEPGLVGNPEEWNESELRERAIALIEESHCGEGKAVLARFTHVPHAVRVVNAIEDVVPAAHEGRVDALVAGFGERMWGGWDAVQRRASVALEDADARCVDLIDLALRETLTHGGQVAVVPRCQVPGGASLAALMRW